MTMISDGKNHAKGARDSYALIFFKIAIYGFTDRLRAIDSTTILQWDVLPGGIEMAGEGDEFGAPVP